MKVLVSDCFILFHIYILFVLSNICFFSSSKQKCLEKNLLFKLDSLNFCFKTDKMQRKPVERGSIQGTRVYHLYKSTLTPHTGPRRASPGEERGEGEQGCGSGSAFYALKKTNHQIHIHTCPSADPFSGPLNSRPAP